MVILINMLILAGNMFFSLAAYQARLTRWLVAVSYTHLDVYKRQGKSNVQLVVGEFPAFGDSQTRAIGTPDEGKTSWAEGDELSLIHI